MVRGQDKTYVVGITGGSGSGKTSFVRELAAALGDLVTVVSQDDYYRDSAEVPKDDQGVDNFDLPESIDSAEMVKDLTKLFAGKTIQRQAYAFETVYRTDSDTSEKTGQRGEMLELRQRPITIVEGLFAMHEPDLHALMDLRVFIDASDVAKLTRRIKRDRVERGLPLEDVLYRYEAHVLPAYEKYLAPHRTRAHLVVNNGVDGFGHGLESLADHLRSAADRLDQ